MTVKSIPLCPVDYIFTGVGSQPITFAFFFQSLLDPQALKRSLDKTLERFPSLRSQLTSPSENTYVYTIIDDGLTFEVVESDLPFDSSRKITDYITPVNSIPGCPLTHIKLTQTSKGSVLGLSVSHALVDGFSYFHFLLSWGMTCRGGPIFDPDLNRDVILSGLSRKTESETVTPDSIYSDCGLFYERVPRKALAGHPEIEQFLIPEETIVSHLKNSETKHGVHLTKNDVITAMLWKKYLPLWNQENGSPKTYVTCPFDFRRIKTGFPPNFFGCALAFATASVGMDELKRASVGELAVLIRNSVSRIKNEFVINSLGILERLRHQDGLPAMEKIHLRHPQQGLIVTNLTRLPLNQIDFGFGPPVHFLAYAEISRSAAILPAAQGVEILVVNPPP